MKLENAEIFAAGRWSGSDTVTATEADLDSIVDAFAALNLAGRVPLKLGHDGPDAREAPESQYALGWVQRVWREGRKLLADLEVPEKVHRLIKDGFLKFVSVELLRNVRAANRELPWVLDAVALLGTDAPAVGILKDLQSLTMSARPAFEHGGRLTFTAPSELERVREELRAAKLALQRQAIENAMESDIGAGTVLPAARVSFERVMRLASDADYERVTVEDWRRFAATQPRPDRSGVQGLGPAHSRQHERADSEVARRVEELMEERAAQGRPLDYLEATRLIFKRDPSLARAWAQSPGVR